VNRRLRGLLVGTALLLVAAMVAGALAVRQAKRAADATDSAVARRVAAQAQLAGSVDRALTLAAAAQQIEESPESRTGLLAALARIPQLSAVRPQGGIWLETSPDGRTLVTLDGDHRLWFHDVRTLERIGSHDPYPDRDPLGILGNVSPLAFPDDGSRLAVAMLDGNDGVVRLLDPETRRPVAAQPGGQPDGAITTDVKLSANGRYLAVSLFLDSSSAGEGQWVYLWDLTRPERPLRRIRMPSDTFHVAFSRDGRLLYAAPGSNSDAAGTGLQVHDVRSGKLLDRRPDGGEALTTSPDHLTLGYGRGAHVILTGADDGVIRRRLRGARGEVKSVVFSPDGRLVAAVSDEPAAHVWEAGTGRHLEAIPLEAAASDVAFDAAGHRLFVPSADRLLAFDLTGADRYVRRTTAADPVPPPVGFSFRDGSPYAPAVVISTWDPTRGESLLRVDYRSSGHTTARLGPATLGPQHQPHAWSPDGRHLAFVGATGWLRVVNWRTGEQIARRKLDVRRLAYTRDGSRILAGGPRRLVLLDAHTLSLTTEPLELPGRLIRHVAVGPGEDTAAVVTAEDAGPVDWTAAADRWLVVDLRTGETLRAGRLHTAAWSMAVSPDRTRMATASPRGMEIIDLRSGQSTVSVDTGATAEAEGIVVTFSPDGELLASADGEGRVSVRDGATGALLGTVHVGDEWVSPAFLDDQALLLPYPDGSTYVWDTSPQYAVDTACRIVGRGLTRDEWRAAFGDRPYEDVCG
jgi:WD40 repeat protein